MTFTGFFRQYGRGRVSYVPVLCQPATLFGMPCQCRTTVAEQAKVDLCPDIECYNLQQPFSSPNSDAADFFMICGPFCFDLLFKRGSMLEHLRPRLLAVLEEELRVKLNTTLNLDFGSFSMLATDLE